MYKYNYDQTSFQPMNEINGYFYDATTGEILYDGSAMQYICVYHTPGYSCCGCTNCKATLTSEERLNGY